MSTPAPCSSFKAILTVDDDGDGIPVELIGQIFERFVQGDQSLQRARGGLGLGLAIVRNIVELRGGSVAAASDGPGTGSRRCATSTSATKGNGGR